MMRKKKMDNKGFSLVELIVVMAIMAILAVTLAPKLMQYIDKARTASDQEVVNTIYTAAKLANAEFPLGKNVTIAMDGAAEVAGPPVVAATGLFTQDGTDFRKWTLNKKYADGTHDDFLKAMIATLSNFTLKTPSTTDTTISLTTDANGYIKVTLSYDPAVTTDDLTTTEQ